MNLNKSKKLKILLTNQVKHYLLNTYVTFFKTSVS